MLVLPSSPPFSFGTLVTIKLYVTFETCRGRVSGKPEPQIPNHKQYLISHKKLNLFDMIAKQSYKHDKGG